MPAARCRLIVNHIRRLDVPEDDPFLEKEFLARMLQEVREKGLAWRNAGEFQPITSSIALLIIVDGDTVACVSMIWTSAAMFLSEVIEKYGLNLQALVEKFLGALELEVSNT